MSNSGFNKYLGLPSALATTSNRSEWTHAGPPGWFGWYLALLAYQRISRPCPKILGIDEYFFTRRHGYATTFCDLKSRM